MFPRLMFSPRDAIFVIKFVVLLIKLHTPYFNLIGLIGYVLKEVLPCILCCTEKESHNLGIFFLELFKTLKHWQNKNNWEKECEKTPGFDKHIVKEGKETISRKEYDGVIKTLSKKILEIVKICLKRDYMSARNAIIMLQKLVDVYPTNKENIKELGDKMTEMILRFEEDDLKTLANSYISILERKMRILDPTYGEKPMPKEETKDGQRRRDDKYNMKSKSKSREQSKGRQSNRGSKSPRRERSGTPRRRERSNSPKKSEKSRSKSKDPKENRRSKH